MGKKRVLGRADGDLSLSASARIKGFALERIKGFAKCALNENSACANFAQTADDGKTYQYKFYNLAAIIAVGYRVNSSRATQFR